MLIFCQSIPILIYITIKRGLFMGLVALINIAIWVGQFFYFFLAGRKKTGLVKIYSHLEKSRLRKRYTGRRSTFGFILKRMSRPAPPHK